MDKEYPIHILCGMKRDRLLRVFYDLYVYYERSDFLAHSKISCEAQIVLFISALCSREEDELSDLGEKIKGFHDAGDRICLQKVLIVLESALSIRSSDSVILSDAVYNDGLKGGGRKFPLIVILDNLRSALNVGSIFRTADAFGVKKIILTGSTPVPDSHKGHKSAMGAEKIVSFEVIEDIKSAISYVRSMGFSVVALEEHTASVNVNDGGFSGRVAVILGNEKVGISDDILNISDAIVNIPMYGYKNSLNVAVSFGVFANTFIEDSKKNK